VASSVGSLQAEHVPPSHTPFVPLFWHAEPFAPVQVPGLPASEPPPLSVLPDEPPLESSPESTPPDELPLESPPESMLPEEPLLESMPPEEPAPESVAEESVAVPESRPRPVDEVLPPQPAALASHADTRTVVAGTFRQGSCTPDNHTRALTAGTAYCAV
jgi:hypothetical protein